MGKGCKEEVKLKKSGPSSAIFNAKTTRNFGHLRLHLTIMSEKDDMLPRPLPSALKFDLASKCSVSSSFQHPLGHTDFNMPDHQGSSSDATSPPWTRPTAHVHASSNTSLPQRPNTRTTRRRRLQTMSKQHIPLVPSPSTEHLPSDLTPSEGLETRTSNTRRNRRRA